ncbi:MAG: MBL fold metallo-hydrolase [Desulfobacterales bacterium]|nr:MBL fold metallo-hydrolase [Deltaproteobacteria bacterium]MBT8362674.1 MBL fold metallo-hydrolase [Deltaproteobacteria bacterium]NNK94137.1 MBL fold metallo-hydrolase [Desulfobacterales bacterium]
MDTRAIREIADDIIVIDTHFHRERFCASYLLLENGKAAFVDVGSAVSIPYLLRALEELNLDTADVTHIILTHIHLDHAGGAGLLLEHCPNAHLWVHSKGLKHMINPEKLINASRSVYGEARFSRMYGRVTAIPFEKASPMEDGMIIDFEGRRLQVMDTPGHARHHFCIRDPKSNGIFVGDTMGMAYPELQEAGQPPFQIPITSPAAFDPHALEKSINRLQAMQPSYYYIAHFGPIPAHPGSVQSLISLIRQHRDIGRIMDKGLDHAAIVPQLRDLYYQAYCSQPGTKRGRAEFDHILEFDLDLNAQGVAVWAARQRTSAA